MNEPNVLIMCFKLGPIEERTYIVSVEEDYAQSPYNIDAYYL